jgi:hypothetical protein
MMTKTIRAKFVCQSVTKDEDASDPTERVCLGAVTADGAGDNAEWSKWTPSGSLQLWITNPGAHGAFEPGKQYYLDITQVE